MNTKHNRLAAIRLFFAALLFLAPQYPSLAAGLACRQDCGTGVCQQVGCDRGAPGNGTCQCGSGAVPLGATTFGSWCLAWESIHSPCTAPAAPAGAASPATGASLTNAAAMTGAVQGSNPYLAILLRAVQDGQNWATGPVRGFIHDSQYDETTGVLSHTVALPFTGAIIPGGTDAVQIDLAVAGDVRQLAGLQQYVATTTPAAVPPLLVHGTITSGGLHGSLLVTGVTGSSQTVQW